MAYGTLSRRSGGGSVSNWFKSLRPKSRLSKRRSSSKSSLRGGKRRSRKSGKSGRRKKSRKSRKSRKPYF